MQYNYVLQGRIEFEKSLNKIKYHVTVLNPCT